jgi:basic membrane protein A
LSGSVFEFLEEIMKKILAAFLVCLLPGLSACSRNKQQDGAVDKSPGTLKAALLVNGNLGDRSFHDSANNGMTMIRDDLGCQIRVVEIGYDDSKWEPAFRDLCDEKYDILICGTWQMQEIVQKTALDYPNQKIIVYDTSMNYDNDTAGAYKNIYSIEYKQNEGSYLAGILAAGMSKSGAIGFVGGMDNTVIRDFLVGYVQGAKDTNPDIKIIPSFIGSFNDTAKAKELALTQYQMGADVIFSVASNAGEGALEASKERNHYVIGVDSDQAMLYESSDPVLSRLIISSMLKRVDQSIFLAVKEAVSGNLPWGTRAVLGISEGCIGLADNHIYESEVPASIRELIVDKSKNIQDGKIKVLTAFGMDDATFTQFLDSSRP